MKAVGIEPGQTLADRYVLERELGRGGMATVYLAQDRRHRRSVAVKVMKPELALAVGGERFKREIEIAANLQHPHILALFDSGEHDGLLYYVMPYIEGESLRARLRREKQLPIHDAIAIAREVASALSYAHERGVVHRDVKPENILLSSGGAMMADFGIARAVSDLNSDSITDSGIALGTPAYMSPEQSSADHAIDGRTDLYALGCVLYEMLVGIPPFVGANARAIATQHMSVAPQPLRPVRPQVPAHVERAVMTALAKTAADRFRTCAEFARALRERVADEPTPVLSDSAMRTAPASTPRLGPLVSRMCNRWNQVNAFDAHFRENHRLFPGTPRFYVIHGDEGQAHDSLVERLIGTRISWFAAEIGGQERGTVPSLRIPWPDGDSVEMRKRDLVISLFREVAPSYMGSELSAATFSRLGAVALSPIVVVRHDVRATAWDAGTEELLRWYANSFWGELTPSAQSPLVVVFLKVIYPPVKSRLTLNALLRPRTRGKAEIQSALQRILVGPDAKCPALIFSELTSVTENDVKDWFSKNGIYDSERSRHALAESIFERAPARRMAEVEAVLEQIRVAFVRQDSLERGNTAW